MEVKQIFPEQPLKKSVFFERKEPIPEFYKHTTPGFVSFWYEGKRYEFRGWLYLRIKGDMLKISAVDGRRHSNRYMEKGTFRINGIYLLKQKRY